MGVAVPGALVLLALHRASRSSRDNPTVIRAVAGGLVVGTKRFPWHAIEHIQVRGLDPDLEGSWRPALIVRTRSETLAWRASIWAPFRQMRVLGGELEKLREKHGSPHDVPGELQQLRRMDGPIRGKA